MEWHKIPTCPTDVLAPHRRFHKSKRKNPQARAFSSKLKNVIFAKFLNFQQIGATVGD